MSLLSPPTARMKSNGESPALALGFISASASAEPDWPGAPAEEVEVELEEGARTPPGWRIAPTAVLRLTFLGRTRKLVAPGIIRRPGEKGKERITQDEPRDETKTKMKRQEPRTGNKIERYPGDHWQWIDRCDQVLTVTFSQTVEHARFQHQRFIPDSSRRTDDGWMNRSPIPNMILSLGSLPTRPLPFTLFSRARREPPTNGSTPILYKRTGCAFGELRGKEKA